MKIQVLIRSSPLKLLFYLINLSLRLFVAKWIRKSEESRLAWRVTEHMGELEDELVVIIREVRYLGEYPPPIFLRVRQHPKDGLESLPVQLRLHI